MAFQIKRKPGTVGKSSFSSTKIQKINTEQIPSESFNAASGIDGEQSNVVEKKWGSPSWVKHETTGDSLQTDFKHQDPPVAQVVNIRKAELNKRGIKDLIEWKKDPNNLYIGRDMSFYVNGADGSKWKNPFQVKKYGRDECTRLYEEHIRSSSLYDELEELKGKCLGCWCHPLPCHGHILVRLLTEKMAKQEKKPA